MAGCLVAAGLGLVLVVAGVILVLVREGEVPAGDPLLDPGAVGYLSLHVDLQDEGERALLERIAQRLREADLTGIQEGTRGFLEEVRRHEGAGFLEPYLPVRAVLVAWPATEGPGAEEPALLAVTVTRKYAILSWLTRYLLWSRAREEPDVRAEKHGGATLTILPSPHGEAGVAVLDNHFLLASRVDDARAAIDRLAGEVPPGDPPVHLGPLRESVREEDEDLWGFRSVRGEQLVRAWRRAAGDADPGAAEAVSTIRALLFAADIVSSDRVRGKLALRVEEVEAAPAAADALVRGIRGALEPAGLRLVLEEEPTWVEERTLLLSGRVEGLDAAIDAMVRRGLDAAAGAPPSSE